MTAKRTILDFIGGDQGRKGLAAIEFAILGPLLGLVLVCTTDLGLGIYRQMQVQTAAQVGAQYAAEHGYNADAITSVVQGAATGLVVSASPSPQQSCGCPGASGVAPAICGTVCPDGNVAGVYVTVSAAGTYTTLIPYPVLPSQYALASRSTVRIQ